MNDNVQVKTGSLDVLAQPPLTVGLVQGTLQTFGRSEVLASDVNVRFVTADGVGRNDHAFDQGVWVPFHDVAVFEGARLAFVRVDDQVLGLARSLGDEGPFSASRKARAAQTA